ERESAFLVQLAFDQQLAVKTKDLDGGPFGRLARVVEPALDPDFLVRKHAILGIEPVRPRIVGRARKNEQAQHQGDGSATHGVFSATVQPSSSGFTRARKPTVKPRTIPSTTAIGK